MQRVRKIETWWACYCMVYLAVDKNRKVVCIYIYYWAIPLPELPGAIVPVRWNLSKQDLSLPSLLSTTVKMSEVWSRH